MKKIITLIFAIFMIALAFYGFLYAEELYAGTLQIIAMKFVMPLGFILFAVFVLLKNLRKGIDMFGNTF